MGRLSIKQKLQKVKTKGRAVAHLLEWSNNYQKQIRHLIQEMDQAKTRRDLRTLGYCIGELDELQKKLFTGFLSITQQLIQPDLPALDPNDPDPLWSEE